MSSLVICLLAWLSSQPYLADGLSCRMAVGSFTCRSLDPPLVALFPAVSSTSFPAIGDATLFAVDIPVVPIRRMDMPDLAMSGGDKSRCQHGKKPLPVRQSSTASSPG